MPEAAPDRSAWPWGFGATLVLAMSGGNYLTHLIAVLTPYFMVELETTRAQTGALTAVLYAVGGIAAPFAGRAADRRGGRILMIVLFAALSTSLIGIAAAPTYPWLVVAVAIGGLSLATNNTGTNALIARHLPRGEQGLILGSKQAGGQLGAVLAGTALPVGVVLVGWRASVLASLALGLLGAIALWVWIPPDAAVRDHARRSPRARLDPVLVAWLGSFALLMGSATATVGAYLPLYAVEVLDRRPAIAGSLAAVMGAIAMLGRLVWGRVTERLSHVAIPLAALGGVSTVSLVLVVCASLTAPWLLWVAAALFGASAGAWKTVAMMGIVRDAAAGSTGRTTGLTQVSYYLGFVGAPVVFGTWLDRTEDYLRAWSAVGAVFALATAVALAWFAQSRRLAAPPSTASPKEHR